MRIALLGLAHETNTFSEVPTDLAKFEADGTLRGREILTKHATAHSTLAGFLSIGDEDIEVVPLIWAWANPSGAITVGTFEALADEMLGLLREQGPWDAVFMAQHGAAVSERFPDADAELVGRVRRQVGPDVPIGVAFDLHANVSQAVVDAATVVVGYLTNPHVDARQRAAECGELIVRTARGEIRPVTAFRAVDAVINILRHSTHEAPMSGIIADALARLAIPGVLSVSVFEGYPYADVAQMGMSCLVITDGDRALAESEAQQIADRVWAERAGFTGHAITPEAAVRRTHPEGPVVLLDVGDNIGAGGDGRSTVLLAAILAAGATGSVIILHDPAAVAACSRAGVGGSVEITVGRPPVAVHGTVRTLTDGQFEEPTPTHGGFRFFDSGPTAVLELAGDNLVMLTSKLVLPTSAEQLRAADIAPERRSLIVAKGVISPRAGYEPVAGELVLVDTPGVTASNLDLFEYRHRRPLYPFDLVDA
jgi:microcystin degradation protein MlrC